MTDLGKPKQDIQDFLKSTLRKQDSKILGLKKNNQIIY